MDLTAAGAAALDRADELAPFRQRFAIPDARLIYLDGNSLGRLPLDTRARLHALLDEEWADQLIRGWGNGWFEAAERIGAKLAQVVGALPHEVLLADSTSVNLFKLCVAALRAQPGRHIIVTDALNFPSDLYVLQGVLQLLGHPPDALRIVPAADGISVAPAALAAAIDEQTALVMLSHTAFKSGFVHPLAEITALAHARGALTLWDLSHTVGAVPVELHAARADLAVGCSYKYLNGGPGAPAFLYVHSDLQARLQNPIQGWIGQLDPFAFEPDYVPQPDLRKFLTGTPPVLSLMAIEPALDLLLEAGLARVRAKSLRQTEYLVALWEQQLEPLGYRLQSPRNAQQRGSHISLGHLHALGIDRALIEELHVLPDFRAPDNLRLGIAPLYNTFAELHAAVQHMRTAVLEQRYVKYQDQRPLVT